MKKITILMAMAAFALFSCSKNESGNDLSIANDPNQINFNSSTGLTRAAANGLTEVKGGFNVLGFKHSTPTDSTTFIDGTDANATYKFTTAWAWNNETGKNWPDVASDYPLTFYAEYPKVDMSTNTNLEKEIVVDLDMANQVDYLVAKSPVAARPMSGFAPLAFKHILSKLVFKIKTSEGNTVYIQSIRVVNTAKKARKFDYATMKYESTEPTYTAADLATTDGSYKAAEGFFYNKNITSGTPWSFTGGTTEATQVDTVPALSGVMMQMPQKTLLGYWTKINTTNGLGKFETDAKAWKNNSGTLDSWYTAAVGAIPAGMKGSLGWEGSRIEVIYRIEDKDGKSLIGHKLNEVYNDGTNDITVAADQFVRVGFPLDLASTAPVTNGWEMSKRYTYTIELGTTGATNGVLLDPDYKDANGDSLVPPVPVDNPTTDPGNPITPGTINFNVSVDEWINGDIAIK